MKLRIVAIVATLSPMVVAGGPQPGVGTNDSFGLVTVTHQATGSIPKQGSAEAADVPQEVIAQEPLIKARIELEEAAARSGVDGLAVVNARHGEGRLDLYWKGEIPKVVAEAIARVEQKFDVVVHDAPYTYVQVVAEIKRILALKSKRHDMGYVLGAAAAHDLSAIRILVAEMPSNVGAARSAINSNMALTFEEARWAANMKPAVAVSRRGDQPPVKPAVAGWRWDDQPPFIGGAVIEHSGFLSLTRCTSAFAARNAADNIRGVFFARHCTDHGDDWETPVGGRGVGIANVLFGDIDVAAITWPTSTPGFPGFAGQVYAGVFNGSAAMRVNGSGWSGMNDVYCTSGGYSGINCRQQVIDRNIFLGEPFGGPLFLTRQLDGIAAVGSGDSGGPIFHNGGNGASARGVISAVDTRSPNRQCVGWNPDNDRDCSDVALYAELQPVLDTLGMTVIFG